MIRLVLPLLLAARVAAADPSNLGDRLADAALAQVRAECDGRCDALFRKQKGKPLVREPIQKDWNNRGDFTRHYNQSILLFAARRLYLNEQVEEANAALREMCEYHLQRPQTPLELHSFQDCPRELVRLCRLYGPAGSRTKGLLSEETCQVILKTLWAWAAVRVVSGDTGFLEDAPAPQEKNAAGKAADRQEDVNSKGGRVLNCQDDFSPDFLLEFKVCQRDRSEGLNLESRSSIFCRPSFCHFLHVSIAVLVLPLAGGTALAGDSLPPLKDGRVPATLDELWGNYDPRSELLEVEVVKEWSADNAVFRYVCYTIGTFKGRKARMLAYYAFPLGRKELPAILHIHGGGQSASFDEVKYAVDNGYAGMSLNWGGNTRLENWKPGDPNTDWGALDCTHPPQRNKNNHFAGPLTPDEFTLDAVESPRNSNWFLVLLAARRAVTFLEQQPEVDPTRIGACGHSMGGKLTTNLVGIEKRVKAAVPSCGGSGTILESQTDLPGCEKRNVSPLELDCVSDNAYIPRITCPILWLSPTNDFHAHMDNMAWNWRNLPDDQVRFSIAPHLNHRHTDEHAITKLLWFEQHLKGVFKMPQTPRLAVELRTPDGIPTATVTPDGSLPVQRVDVYYSIDPHGLTRFWRDARTEKAGNQWQALCPVMSLEQPLFVYANVIYECPEKYRTKSPGRRTCETFALSSRVWSAAPAQLQAAGVKTTDKAERLIDDGSRGWRDWYQLNWDHPPLWFAATRKLKDPKWRGPDGAKLLFEIKSETDNTLVLRFHCNAWGAFTPGKPAVEYAVVKHLKASPGWQTVAVSLDELAAMDPRITTPLANWQTVTEFTISPSGEIVQDGQRQNVAGKPWRGPREIRNLRWEGGSGTNG